MRAKVVVNGEISIEASNVKRAELYLEMRFYSVIDGPVGLRYRVLNFDNEGFMLEPTYTIKKPEHLEKMLDKEDVSLSNAAEFLGITKKDLVDIIKSDKHNYPHELLLNVSIPLDVVNEYKDKIQE